MSLPQHESSSRTPVQQQILPVIWKFAKDLNYEPPSSSPSSSTPLPSTTTSRFCSWCAKPLAQTPLTCSRCKVSTYCPTPPSSTKNPCQLSDYKRGGHKANCPALSEMTVVTSSTGHVLTKFKEREVDDSEGSSSSSAEDEVIADPLLRLVCENVTTKILMKIRMYMCPFHVCNQTQMSILIKGEGEGEEAPFPASPVRGFVFLQSVETAATLTLPSSHGGLSTSHGFTTTTNFDAARPTGAREPRMVNLTWLTLVEFDKEVITTTSSFELAILRDQLKLAVEKYDLEKECVVLCRFRCGFLALGVEKLVPDFGVCLEVGKDYVGRAEVGLELD